MTSTEWPTVIAVVSRQTPEIYARTSLGAHGPHVVRVTLDFCSEAVNIGTR